MKRLPVLAIELFLWAFSYYCGRQIGTLAMKGKMPWPWILMLAFVAGINCAVIGYALQVVMRS